MKRHVLGLFVLSCGMLVPLGEGAARALVPPTDFELLQGAWKVVKVVPSALSSQRPADVKARFVFAGDKFRVFHDDKLFATVEFKLSKAGPLNALDEMWTFAGKEQRRSAIGIYALAGDDLVLVYNFADPKNRPTSLEERLEYELVYLKRVK